MGYYSNKMCEQMIADRGYKGPSANHTSGICEVCSTEYSYDEYKDDTPGFREHEIYVKPCRCGKYYGNYNKRGE